MKILITHHFPRIPRQVLQPVQKPDVILACFKLMLILKLPHQAQLRVAL